MADIGTVHFRGDPFPQEQNYTEHYDPENGYSIEIEWEGQQPDWIIAYCRQKQRAGCATNMSFQQGIGRLTVNDTTGQTAIDKWEIDADQIVKSNLLNPRINNPASSSYIAPADLKLIASVNAGYKNYLTVRAAFVARALDSALRELDRQHLGDTDYESEGDVLRHTTNVSNRYDRNISDTNKGRIYTTAQLLTEVRSSALWNYPLPGRLVYKIQTIVNNAIAERGIHAFYQWGWLKSTGTESSAAAQRVNISTIYKFDEWSTDKYLLAV